GESLAELVRAFVRSSTAPVVAAAADLAARGDKLDPGTVERTLWQALASSRLVWQGDDGNWHFLPGVEEQLAMTARADFGRAERPATSPGVPPGTAGARPLETIRATVRMYRQGFGDCFLLSLKGDREDYRILVNCGVILGTPDAVAIMSGIVKDILATTGG